MVVWVGTGGGAWPEADEDRIRQLAQEWRNAAQVVNDQMASAGAQADALAYLWQGQSGGSFHKLWRYYQDEGLPKLTETLDALATRHDEAAREVEYEKLTIIFEVGVLMATIFAIIVLSFISFGAALSLAAGPIAWTRLAVAQALRQLIAAASRGFVRGLIKEVAFEAISELATDVAAQLAQFAMGTRTQWDLDKSAWSLAGGALGGLLGGLTAPGFNKLGRQAPGVPGRIVVDGAHETVVDVGTEAGINFVRTGEVDLGDLSPGALANRVAAEGLREGVSDLYRDRLDAVQNFGAQMPAPPPSGQPTATATNSPVSSPSRADRAPSTLDRATGVPQASQASSSGGFGPQSGNVQQQPGHAGHSGQPGQSGSSAWGGQAAQSALGAQAGQVAGSGPPQAGQADRPVAGVGQGAQQAAQVGQPAGVGQGAQPMGHAGPAVQPGQAGQPGQLGQAQQGHAGQAAQQPGSGQVGQAPQANEAEQSGRGAQASHGWQSAPGQAEGGAAPEPQARQAELVGANAGGSGYPAHPSEAAGTLRVDDDVAPITDVGEPGVGLGPGTPVHATETRLGNGVPAANVAPPELVPAAPADGRRLEQRIPRTPDGAPQLYPNPLHHNRWVQFLNDGGTGRPGRAGNCVDCVRAFLSTWYGNPHVAGALQDGLRPEPRGVDRTAEWLGAPLTPSSLDELAEQLRATGHGASAAITLAFQGNTRPAHMIVAVNHHGTIVWVDPQDGQVSVGQPLDFGGDVTGSWAAVLDDAGRPVRQQVPTDTPSPAEAGTTRDLFTRILGGDERAARELVVHMRIWEEGIAHLTHGTDFAAGLGEDDRTRVIAALVSHRDRIVAQVAGLDVRPMTGGSTNPGSDVDLEASGPDAGRNVLRAEQWFRDNFGDDWRTQYRMGVLINSERVAGVVEAIDAAPPEIANGLRAGLVGTVERLLLARQVRHVTPGERPALLLAVPAELRQEVRELSSYQMEELLRVREQMLIEGDRRWQAAQQSVGDPVTRARHAVGAARAQLMADFADEEAYVSVGAKRKIAAGLDLGRISLRAEALDDQLAMLGHLPPGELVRRYETWKYVIRATDLLRSTVDGLGGLNEFAKAARARRDDGSYGVDHVDRGELEARYDEFRKALALHRSRVRSPLPGHAGGVVHAPAIRWGVDPPRTLPDDHPLLTPTHTIDTDEREAWRTELVESIIGDARPAAEGERPVIYLMGGGGAAGKGTLLAHLQNVGVIPVSNVVALDPDGLKERIPEYRQIVGAGDSRAAAVTHEESSRLKDRILDTALERRLSIVYDVTLGNPHKALKLFDRLRHNGYHIKMFGVTVGPTTAVQRADARATGSGRFVPIPDQLAAHQGFSRGFPAYAELADLAIVFDTHQKPRIICGTEAGAPLRVRHAELYQAFRHHAGLDPEAGGPATLHSRQSAVERSTARPPTAAEYIAQGLDNLARTSRTAGGVIDTSASADKAGQMADDLSGAEAARRAQDNFRRVLTRLHDERNLDFATPVDLRRFVESVATQVNQGIIKEGVLYRQHDSDKYRSYTKTADLPAAADDLYRQLHERLRAGVDPVETAAWLEYRMDLTDHMWADGCGKTSKALAAWVLMRAGWPLPTYPAQRAAQFAAAPMFPRAAGRAVDELQFALWLDYYRGLFLT